MRNYYIHDGSNQLGPFTFLQLKNQSLSKKTPVWFEGLSEWTSVEQLPELLDYVNTPPPFVKNLPPPTPNFAVENSVVNQDVITIKKSLKIPIMLGSFFVAIVLGWVIYSSASTATPISNTPLEEQTKGQSEEKRREEEDRKRANEELTRKNMNYRNNWRTYIKAGRNSYRYSNLGGIYGLEVIISNSTEYLVDEVVADVKYIKSNGEVWKTVQVPVTNVPPNSRKSLPLEDVERSTSVEVSINSIMSKKMHFLYSSDYYSGNAEDPSFLK